MIEGGLLQTSFDAVDAVDAVEMGCGSWRSTKVKGKESVRRFNFGRTKNDFPQITNQPNIQLVPPTTTTITTSS